ncbi:hypothetical protein V8D89_004786 [Ganoderma adspersum]
MRLFMDAFTLQPCNPTFPNARDAWIQADANWYGGEDYCRLWTVFASRGLGIYAVNHKNNFDTPAGC